MTEKPARVAILSTADWDAPIWTNKQHIARELSHEVLVDYVDSVGLRRPTLSSADVRRAVARMRAVVRPAHGRRAGSKPQNVQIVTPLAIPRAQNAATTRWNEVALRQQLRSWRSTAGARILWTFSPATYGLERIADSVVYHCVDLMEYSPGVDRALVKEQERRLATVASVAIASSRVVADHLVHVGFKDIVLWENVADTRLFSSASSPASARSDTRVAFVGHLTNEKVDLDLLVELATLPGIELHVAGPSALDGTAQMHHLVEQAGVISHGVLEPSAVAQLVGRCSVGLIPYHLNPGTRGVFPLKLFEYLAAGARVLSTPIPAVVDREGIPGVRIADRSAFVGALLELVSSGLTDADIEENQAAAREHSWERRGADARRLVRELASRSMGR